MGREREVDDERGEKTWRETKDIKVFSFKIILKYLFISKFKFKRESPLWIKVFNSLHNDEASITDASKSVLLTANADVLVMLHFNSSQPVHFIKCHQQSIIIQLFLLLLPCICICQLLLKVKFSFTLTMKHSIDSRSIFIV